MRHGKKWQPFEDQFLRDCVEKGLSNAEIIHAFRSKYGPNARGPSGIKKRRSEVCGDIPPRFRQNPHTSSPNLLEPDENVHVNLEVGEESAKVHVLASRSIKNPEMLFEKSGLDPEKWELVPTQHEVKKWDVPMKLDNEAVIVPCWYVAIRVRLKYQYTSMPSPIAFEMPERKRAPAIGNQSTLTTVHFSDIHFPYHDPACVEILYQILEDLPSVEFVADQGDTIDCQEISSYPKDPTERIGLKEEILQGAQHFATVTDLAPNAQKVWTEGNHEDRLRRLIWSLAESRQAGEILTLEPVKASLQWGSLLGLDSLGWEVIPYPSHHLLWNLLVVCHGETARQGSGQSEKAELTKYSKSGVSGHTHRIGFYGQRIYDGSLGWWGLGCMCTLTTSYINHPNWQQGFAVINWAPDKKTYSVERVRVHNGKAIFRGKTYG